MKYVVEVLMKFKPSLQLQTRATPGNQESFATKPNPVPKQPTEAEQSEYQAALQALIQDEIVEIDAAQKIPKNWQRFTTTPNRMLSISLR